ncbi:MAG: AAA family ATPase [Terracidiphilus sp.]|nr:AAA family ATPase [Terracidiphilus sp.]
MSDSTYPSSSSTHKASYDAGSNHGKADTGSSTDGEQNPELRGPEQLSIVLIGPDKSALETVALAFDGYPLMDVRKVFSYPSNVDELSTLTDLRDVVIIDLDSNPEVALELVENISVLGTATVMVISAEASPDKLMRSMRAGAREFLTVPIDRNTMEESLIRASARRPANQHARTETGKLLAFIGSKGGVGVTTLACTFALALAHQSSQSTLLIDLAFPIGDAALTLGVQPEYSTFNALQAADRLDSSFLCKLLVKHPSGLAVLSGPNKFVPRQFPSQAIAKLIAVARQTFDHVVIDAGSKLDPMDISLLSDASVIYLITQVAVADLRNSNRFISQSLAATSAKIEIVLNRHNPRSTTVPEEYIAKVLTKSPKWIIPNDYGSVQRLHVDGIQLIPGTSPISLAIQEMASSVTGQPPPKKKRRGFGLFS